MTYIATIQTSKQAFRVATDDNKGHHTIQLEDKILPIDWQHIASLASDSHIQSSEGGHFSLLIAEHSYDIFARRITKKGQKDSQTYEIFIEGQRFEVTVEDERTLLLSSLVKGSASSGTASINAPMPGLVVGVPVEQGTLIQEGATVVILEAMKMENDLTAPISGIIQEIHVKKGQAVDQGEILVVIASE